MQNRGGQQGVKNSIYSWYPAFLDAVFRRHQETYDFNFNTIFTMEALATEPVVLILSLELLDRLFTFKNKDEISKINFPVSNELLILVVIFCAAQYCIDRSGVFSSKAPLLRAGIKALQLMEGIQLVPNRDNAFSFIKSLAAESTLSQGDINLFLAHLFYLDISMSADSQSVEDYAILSGELLTLFGRDADLFNQLSQALQAEKVLAVMKSDIVLANLILSIMVAGGCFNQENKSSVASLLPTFNSRLQPIYALACKASYYDLSKCSPIEGLNCGLEHKILSSRYMTYHILQIDDAERHRLLEKYYKRPHLTGSLERIFNTLFQAGIFDLFDTVSDGARRRHVFHYIFKFIKDNGKTSVDETIEKIMTATRGYFLKKHAPFQAIVVSALIPNFLHYQDIMRHSLMQVYRNLQKSAGIQDEISAKEMRKILKTFTRGELLGFTHIANIISQNSNGLEYQLFELVAKNIALLDIFKDLFVMFDLCELMDILKTSDFVSLFIAVENISRQQLESILASYTQRDQFISKIANEMLYHLLANKRCEITDKRLVPFADAFNLNLRQIEESLKNQSQYFCVPLSKVSQVTMFSMIDQPTALVRTIKSEVPSHQKGCF